MEPVRNHRNEIVVEAARLHRGRHRRDRAQTLLEGPALLSDALGSGCRVRSVFAVPDDDHSRRLSETHDLPLTLVDGRALARLAGTETPRGPVAVVDIPDEQLAEDRDLLVSWGVSDPGNVGALIRTAAAFGWGFGYSGGTADPWAPKTLRAGAGGQFQTAVGPVRELADLTAWETIATVVAGGESPSDVSAPLVAVLIGEEASGLPDEVAGSCARRVSIPIEGPTESLNAAVAAGIVVYELSNRSRQSEAAV